LHPAEQPVLLYGISTLELPSPGMPVACAGDRTWNDRHSEADPLVTARPTARGVVACSALFHSAFTGTRDKPGVPTGCGTTSGCTCSSSRSFT
jgi:hypothetical protein